MRKVSAYFYKDHHNIKSVQDLFAFISEKRQVFQTESDEDNFQRLLEVVKSESSYHKLPFENIDFKLRSVSDFYPEGAKVIDGRKGFVITMNLTTKACNAIKYSITFIIEKNKLEIAEDQKELKSQQQKIQRPKFPCF